MIRFGANGGNAQVDELIIFDRNGIAKVFVSGGVFYDYSGRPLAFLDDKNIVSYSGKRLGWFQDGYVRDEHGDAVDFTEVARGGPITLVSTIPPISPIPPISSLSWSLRTLEQFFTG